MLTENLSASSDKKDCSRDNSDKFESNQPSPISFTDTIVSHKTPVLYSTNRGLFLRKANRSFSPATSVSVAVAASATAASSTSNSRSSAYELSFCDLERWSTNRANSICLNDTINSQTYSLNNPNRPSVRFSTVERNISENYDQESAFN